VVPILLLATPAWLAACKGDVSANSARHWNRCTCSYISDFDEPGAALVEVCSAGQQADEIAATCVRNDGVGIPTRCQCETTPRGRCDKNDRCRPVKTPPM
jgi:hypothetical protein